MTDDDRPGPRGCTNFKLRQLTRRVSQHYDRVVAECGLKTTQYSLLTHVDRLGPVRPTDLAAAMAMDPSTLTREAWTDVEERQHYRKIACSPCVHTSEEPPCRGDNRCIQGLFADQASAPVGWTPIEYPRRRRAPVTT